VDRVISALLVVAAVIHLVPVSGVLSAQRLTALYDLPFQEPNLEILMRHRAVLFGLLGVVLLAAACMPALQPVAFAGGFVSVISFLVIAASVGGYNGAVRRIFVGDIVALIALCGAFALWLSLRVSGGPTA